MMYAPEHQILLIGPFECWSPASAAWAEIDGHAIINEIDRECQKRRGFYPKQVEARKMSQASATHEIQIMRAMLDDLTAGHWVDCRFTWAEKIKSLRREINFRRAVYPRLIEQGKADADAAKRQLERIEAVHVKYWARCDLTKRDTDLITGEACDTAHWRSQIEGHLRCFENHDAGTLDPNLIARMQNENSCKESSSA